MKKKNWETYLGSGKLLGRAIEKYGKEAFHREIIQYCDSIDEAIKAEKDFILENECHLKEDWYNIAVGFTTQGFRGKKQTEKHKLAMQKLLTGIPKSKESTKKQSETRKQKIKQGLYSFNNHTSEQIEMVRLLGKNNKGKKRSDETKLKMSNSHKNKTFTEQTKNNISKSKLKCWTLENINGEVIQVNNLIEWTSKNNIKYGTIYNSISNKKFYDGWRILGNS
jgi:hypothetical protein